MPMVRVIHVSTYSVDIECEGDAEVQRILQMNPKSLCGKAYHHNKNTKIFIVGEDETRIELKEHTRKIGEEVVPSKLIVDNRG